VCAFSRHDVGIIPDVLSEAGCDTDYTFRSYEYRDYDFRPRVFNPARHAGLIILGEDRPFSADDDRVFGTEMYWVCVARQTGKAVLGICHGAQLVAHVCGGAVIQANTLADHGLIPVELTADGADDPVTQPVNGHPVAQWHYYTIDLPAETVNLANSQNVERPHSDAFRIGGNVYGLQFHPEPTAHSLSCDGWAPHRQPPADEAEGVEQTGRAVLKAWIEIACGGHA
jgi:GMP synthase-like glutamine amidotransferase